MKTIIDVVNGRVLVKTDGNKAREYSYSTANFLSTKNVTTSLLGPNVLNTKDPERIKAVYSKAGDMLGISVAQYVRQIKGAAKRAYIDPINDLVKRFCLVMFKPYNEAPKWEIDPYRVDLLNNYKYIVQEYINDGNSHLAAYGMLVGNAKQAKCILGKGLWKKISNTSRTRNDLIWDHIFSNMLHSSHGMDMHITKIKELIEYYHNIPTTLLRVLKRSNIADCFLISNAYGIDNLIMRIVKYLGEPMCKISNASITQQLDIVRDTANMREGFNNKWSITRINKEHEAAMRDHFIKTFPKDIYRSTYFLTSKYEYEGCTAEMITSSFELAMHGKDQKHCVANYASKCASGEYVVFKIVDAEGKVSTLGIANPNNKSYLNTQHYLAYNQVVENKDALELARIINTDVMKIMKDHPEMITLKSTTPNYLFEPNVDNDIPF